MTYAYGWTDSDIARGVSLARYFDAEPRDIFGLWYHEGNLNPRIHPFGDYYGLIGGSEAMVSPALGYSWASLVEGGSLAQQLDAIQGLWAGQQNQLGESFARRASRIGTTPAAMIYAMNFVPAYARNMQSADQALIPGSNPFYSQNITFDVERKGYITIRDLEDRIAFMVQKGFNDATVGPIFRALPAPGIGSALSRVWRSPAGKAVTVVAVGGAAIAAFYYVKYGRLPTRRDLHI